MYQPYPTGAQMPATQRPPVPPSVANAVRVMYVGALTSILGILFDVLTVSATKRSIEKRSPNLSASQVNSVQHVLVVAFIIGGLIGAAVWIVLARLCKNGKNGARITGTVLFGLATLDTLIGAAAAPIAGAVRAWGLVVWLVGLVAVIFLWRPSSTAFFKGAPPR
ncbi:MAG TPA: hypothetical protein VME19_06655 [Streptosporangiaceae bacterium]|nr:hypothetical protein [Streptosporangiaceae bacterium]